MQPLREAYRALVQHVLNGAAGSADIRQSGTENLLHPPLTAQSLDQKTYPNVKFWHKAAWTEYSNDQVPDLNGKEGSQPRGRARAAQNINVAMRYVENENGETVDGNRATDMRKFARTIWVTLAKKGAQPATWGQADLETRRLYCSAMSDRFFELKLCHLDWKAEQIATDNYPSWHANWLKQGMAQVKEENEGASLAPRPTTMKRSRKGSSTTQKRMKLDTPAVGTTNNVESIVQTSIDLPPPVSNDQVSRST